jgi:hypothetical protein
MGSLWRNKGSDMIKAGIVLLFLIFSFCSSAFAGSLQLGIEAGMAYPGGRFKDTEVSHLVAGYESESMLFAQIGVFEFGGFELSDSAAKIEIEGVDFQIGKIFAFGGVSAGMGLGAFYWDAAALLEGRRIGEDSGSSLLFDLRISFDISPAISLYGGGKHLQDVSGSDINLLMFGSRLSF